MNNGYSICFNEWALDKEIKDELGLLLIISSLCAEKGYCWANNKYFSDLFNISEVTISRKIKKLESKKYINIEYKKRGCEIISRYIRLTNLITDDYQKCKSTIIKNDNCTINKNDKENNIINNNINNNNINNNIYNVEMAKEIIDYLNLRTGAKYKYTTPKTQTLIKSRLREGFTVEDFKTVIDKKCVEWFNDSKMKQYIRPETLFGTKFEGYLNQEAVKKEVTTKDLAKHIDWEEFLNE